MLNMNFVIVKLTVLFILFIHSNICVPITEEDSMKYLHKYGYMESENISDMSEHNKSLALQEFQEFVQIPVTGNLDNTTKEIMKQPRCGMPDKRYTYIGRFQTKYLTYKIKNKPNNYNATVIIERLINGMNLWLNYTDITTEKVTTDNANIEIEFLDPDDSKFTSNEIDALIVGNGYAPINEHSRIEFPDEDWDGYENINFVLVAAHEFGHSLGLDHRDNNESIMYPYFLGKEEVKLHETDISYVQALYGVKHELCTHGELDAIFTISDYHMYILRNGRCWKFQFGRLVYGYPKYLSQEWPQLPRTVKTAFYADNYIYFSDRKNVWKYSLLLNTTVSNFTLDNDFATAVVISAANTLYTFKGSQYWKYSLNNNDVPVLRKGFPKYISNVWKGVPSDINAVYFDRTNYLYFFKNNFFYTVNINNLQNGAIEKPISQWIGCSYFY